jgi:hypothetical protein
LKGKYAENSPFWRTTVNPYKSQGEITALLDDFGAEAVGVMSGRIGGETAWMIRFNWRGHSYRFEFQPLPLKPRPKFAKDLTDLQKKKLQDQRICQMGRIALTFVKAMLTAADTKPSALFGFMELPDVGKRTNGLPFTAGQLDTSNIQKTFRALPSSDDFAIDSNENQVYEVPE